jgi:hypothetical protein
LSHHLRVPESLVLPIRRPGAVCVFEASSRPAGAGAG